MDDKVLARGALRRDRPTGCFRIRRRTRLRGSRGGHSACHGVASATAPLPVLDLTGKTSLLQLAALAEQSDLFVSNDTGPLHLAAAMKTPVVGVFTCTDPLTGPYGPHAVSVQSCVGCAPSFRKTCDRLECFAELHPDRVWLAVHRRLGASRESSCQRPGKPPSQLLVQLMPGMRPRRSSREAELEICQISLGGPLRIFFTYPGHTAL